MAKLEDVILRDDRASQPLATAVAVGTLYFVTDESVTERSNGTTWDDYSGGGGGGSDWTTTVVKSLNQDVTNNATPQVDTELLIAVTSGDIWRMEAMIVYGGNDATNARFKWDFVLPTMFGWLRYIAFEDPSLAAVKDTGVRISNETLLSNSITPTVLGTQDAALTKRVLLVEAMFRAGSSANFQLKFGNAVGGGGVTSRVFAGSTLRGRKLS